MAYNKHMIFEMLRWWYATGWLQAAQRVRAMTQSTSRTFSMPLLVQTLFSPWKRVVSLPGRSFDAKIAASLDNFVSRCVGFAVRVLVLIAACLATLGTFLVGLGMAVVWPFVPLLVVFSS